MKRPLKVVLRIGELVETSDHLRHFLKKTGLASPAQSTYSVIAKQLQSSDNHQIEINGAKGTFSPPIGPRHLTNELPILRKYVSDIHKHDGPVWDVGANVGLFTIIGSDATNKPVVAFEPIPENCNQIKKNADLNNRASSIEIHNIALGSDRDTLQIILEIEQLSSDGDIEVEVFPGDLLIEQEEMDPPKVMKIDVEGAEVDVLSGLEKTLQSKKCEIIYIEIHPELLSENGYSPEDVHKILDKSGYSIERVATSGDGRYSIRANI